MAFGIKTIGGGNVNFDASPTTANTTVTIDNVTGIPVYGDSVTGALILPSGTTAERTVSPVVGALRWNSTLGVREIWNGYNWGDISGRLPSTYRTQRSLRFRASASAHLGRTFSAGNRKTWTLSTWIKRGTLGSAQVLFDTGVFNTTDSTYANIGFTSADTFNFGAYNVAWRTTTQVFRDPSAWYHIVLAFDTTQAIASNRVNLYVNGTKVTAFSTSNDPTLNTDYAINQAAAHYFGYPASIFNYFDGYLAEVNFIDGQALTPDFFGEVDVIAGTWIPKAYTGTYGTNGFYLPFTNTTSTTTLVSDSSGNGNNWTPNNISLTAGVNYDSMTDVPTLTSATASNFPVLNRILPAAGLPDIRDANLFLRCADASNFTAIPATMLFPQTGKWYAEFTAIYVDGTTSILDVGLLDSTDFPTPSGVIGASAKSYGYRNTGSKINNSSATSYGASYIIGDVIAIAFDATAGTLTFYKNNVSQGVAFTGLTAQYFFAVGGYNFAQWQCNFGQRPFTYTPPTGFVALNTFNLT